MIGSVSAHRRAHAFAEALDEQSRRDRAADQESAAEPPGFPAGDPEQGRLLALTAGLGELPAPELDPEVRVVQRAQLVAAMETMLAEGGGAGIGPVPEQRTGKHAHRAGSLGRLRPRSRWSKGLAAGGLTVGVAAGAFSGVAAASSEALPGDSLYGLKLGMEHLQLGFADDDRDRGRVHLDQASTRLHEARRLMERERAGALDEESVDELRHALSGMRHDAVAGHRLLHAAYERDGSLDPIRTLNAFSETHRDGWRTLKDRLPVQLTDVRDQVTSVFDAMDEDVGPLKSLLPDTPGGEAGAQDGSSDSAGPSGPQSATQLPEPSRSRPSESGSGSEEEPRPSESGRQKEGLIGGPGGLLDPPDDEAPTSPGGSGGGTPGEPDVTLPPLLPGLLPGLGIDADGAD
ncbi:MAG TPA: hypothetical protein DEQ61_05225 [Streptomyces sp.]|nr:hypothetical protein [Streptomyces sp.]